MSNPYFAFPNGNRAVPGTTVKAGYFNARMDELLAGFELANTHIVALQTFAEDAEDSAVAALASQMAAAASAVAAAASAATATAAAISAAAASQAFVVVTDPEFGAVGDGVTDDSAAIQAADYYLYKNFGGGNLYFPNGDYLLQASGIYKRSSVNWIGQASPGYFAASLRGTRIKRHTSLATMIFHAGSLYEIRNIEFEGSGGDASGTATKIFGLPSAGVALPADDPLRPGVTTYQKGSSLWLYQCTLSNCWYAIHDNTNFGAVNMRECTVRQFITAVVNTSDSRYIDNIFVGSSYAAMSQNVGGIIIRGGLVEFQRNGTDGAAHGFVFHNNANEIQVDGVRFDRNAGHDIIVMDGAKRPHTIMITNCFHGRGAWGADQSVRTSITLDNADNVTVVGNTFMSASSFPSTIQGLISPRAAISHYGCTGLILYPNNFARLANRICLTDISLVAGTFQMWPNWVESASGTGEWYLTSAHDADLNPWIGEPGFVENEGALLASSRALIKNNASASNSGSLLTVTVADGHGLTAGSRVSISDVVGIDVDEKVYEVASVIDAGGGNDYINITHAGSVGAGTVDIYTAGAGALSAGQYDWADNDNLGFSTLYARVTGDTDPGLGDIYAIHDGDPIISQLNHSSFTERSTDIQTAEWKDVYRENEHAGRVLLTNNAVAVITSNVLAVTVADGHGVVAGDWVYLSDPVTVSVTPGAYQVTSVTDAGGGNDYINIAYTAANATGTIDISTLAVVEFVLRTRQRCMTAGSLSVTLAMTAHGVSPAYRMYSRWPLTIVRENATALPAVLNGTIQDHNSNLSHNWHATSSENNLSVLVSSDIRGDRLTLKVFNTTVDDITYTIGIPQ